MYCGIDASTTNVGIGILEGKELIHYECITPKDKNWENRVGIISIRLNELFNEYKIDEEIYIEDLVYKDGKPTLAKLACVRGAIKAISSLHNIKLNPDSVSDWRRNAGFYDGTKEGSKRDVMKKKAIERVKELFNIDVDDNTAEGILIAYYHKYPMVKKRKIGR